MWKCNAGIQWLNLDLTLNYVHRVKIAVAFATLPRWRFADSSLGANRKWIFVLAMFVQYGYSPIKIKSKSPTNYSPQTRVDVFKCGNGRSHVACVINLQSFKGFLLPNSYLKRFDKILKILHLIKFLWYTHPHFIIRVYDNNSTHNFSDTYYFVY